VAGFAEVVCSAEDSAKFDLSAVVFAAAGSVGFAQAEFVLTARQVLEPICLEEMVL